LQGLGPGGIVGIILEYDAIGVFPAIEVIDGKGPAAFELLSLLF
jgi:hypothetical protein